MTETPTSLQNRRLLIRRVPIRQALFGIALAGLAVIRRRKAV